MRIKWSEGDDGLRTLPAQSRQERNCNRPPTVRSIHLSYFIEFKTTNSRDEEVSI